MTEEQEIAAEKLRLVKDKVKAKLAAAAAKRGPVRTSVLIKAPLFKRAAKTVKIKASQQK